jgi:predicted nucleic acid-binding protein
LIILDTSVLIDALTGPRRSAPQLRQAIARGERILFPTLVLYEWLRGPRLQEELEAQEALFPSKGAVPFGADDALSASRLYRTLPNPWGREIDLAIAAVALGKRADLWTLNPRAFADIPGLSLYSVPP